MEEKNIDWREYFKQFAKTAAIKSKDPSTKVGAVIIDKNNRIISTGFNGFPQRCQNIMMSYDRPDKYGSIIHAEMNALIYAKTDLTGMTLFCTEAPCDNCLKHIIASNISKVIYENSEIMKNRGTPEELKTLRRLLKATPDLIVENVNGLKYLDDLDEKASPFEKFHPHGKFYSREELREGNEYIVFENNQTPITRVKVKCGILYENFGLRFKETNNVSFLKI